MAQVPTSIHAHPHALISTRATEDLRRGLLCPQRINVRHFEGFQLRPPLHKLCNVREAAPVLLPLLPVRLALAASRIGEQGPDLRVVHGPSHVAVHFEGASEVVQLIRGEELLRDHVGVALHLEHHAVHKAKLRLARLQLGCTLERLVLADVLVSLM